MEEIKEILRNIATQLQKSNSLKALEMEASLKELNNADYIDELDRIRRMI